MINTPIKNGLILGAIMGITAILMVIIDATKYLQFAGFIYFVLAVGFMIKIGRDSKKLNEGILSFGEAFKDIFIGATIGYLILSCVEFSMDNFIFKDLPQTRLDFAIDALDKVGEMVESFSGESIMDDMETAKDNITLDQVKMTAGNTLMSFFIRLIFPVTVLGLIIALIVKKEPSGV